MSKKEESIWKKLSNIDCNKFTKSKGQLTYLSWPYAWKIVMENYPKATYKFKEWDGYDVLYYKNGTGAVACEVTIDGISREMWLAVMDYRNRSIPDPSSTDISNTKMRCLVKCLAMFGLGHYIYAGEDLPTNIEAVIKTVETNFGQSGKAQSASPPITYDGLNERFNKASHIEGLKAIVSEPDVHEFLRSLKEKDEEKFNAMTKKYNDTQKQLTKGKNNGK